MMLYNMLYYNALKERGTRTPILIIIKTIQIIVITIIIMTFIMIITIRIFRKSLLIKMSLSLSLSLTHTHTLPQVLSVVLRNLKVQSPILPTITMAAVLVVVMVVVVGLKEVEVEVRIMQSKVYSSRVKVEVSNNLTTTIIREPISKVTVLSTYGMIHIPSRSCSTPLSLYSTVLYSPLLH